MANKIRKFNGYHYVKATKDLEVEDSVHAATFEKGDTFLIGNLKGKYYLVDVDLDEKEAYRYLISEKAYIKFIEQERILQPAIVKPHIPELVKELISTYELKCSIEDYPEVLAYISGTGLKKRKSGKQVTLKITSTQARLAASMLKMAIKDSKVDQTLNNLQYIKPKAYENIPKETYFKMYLKHAQGRLDRRQDARYSSHDAVVDAQQDDLLSSHPLAGSRELKAYLDKHLNVKPEAEDSDGKSVDDALTKGTLDKQYKAKVANYEKQLAQIYSSPIYKNASNEALEKAKHDISVMYNPDHVAAKPEAVSKSPKDLFSDYFNNEFHSTYVSNFNIGFEVKENEKSLFINLPKLPLDGAPLMTYEEPLRELVGKLKRDPNLAGFNPKLYVGHNPYPYDKTYHMRLFLFKK